MEIEMGDWSDYFEAFPEENPANQVPKRTPLEQARDAIASQQKGKGAAQAELNQLIRQSKQAAKALDEDGFVELVLRLAAEQGLKVEERRPGRSICFNETSDKWLSEQHLRQLFPAILEANLSDAKINQLIEHVAPGRPCTHVGMRQILARVHEVGGWAPGAGG